MKLLIVAAHPDDEVLGAGVVIRRSLLVGHEVHVLFLCENSVRHGKLAAEGLVHHAKAMLALCEKNQPHTQSLALTDQSLDKTDFPSLAKKIAEVVARVRPDLIITHSKDDLNRDHKTAHEATAVACRHISRPHEVWEMFVPSASDVAGQPWMTPNVFVPCNRTAIERKVLALECYVDELGHPQRSAESLFAWAGIWGRTANVQFAEAYRLVKRVV